MRFGARGRARENLQTRGSSWGPREERPGSAENRLGELGAPAVLGAPPGGPVDFLGARADASKRALL